MKITYSVPAVLFMFCTAALSAPSAEKIQAQYRSAAPTSWGERVAGVITRAPVGEKVVFFTFDACGGVGGSSADSRLIALLRREKIPATLFINSRWIDANPALFAGLAKDPLFSIQNHGTSHRPLSVTGRRVYRIRGTDSPRGVYDEIMGCDAKIFSLTGKHPRFFRSGTAFYDDVAVKIASALGYKIAGFDVLGDGGATFSAARIAAAAVRIRPGSIVIYHMNQPKKATFAGLARVIPQMKKQGWRFARMEEYF